MLFESEVPAYMLDRPDPEWAGKALRYPAGVEVLMEDGGNGKPATTTGSGWRELDGTHNIQLRDSTGVFLLDERHLTEASRFELERLQHRPLAKEGSR